MAEKVEDTTLDLSLQAKLRRARIARLQLENAKRRFERTDLQQDFEDIAKKQAASDKADAELNGNKPKRRVRDTYIQNKTESGVDARFVDRWGKVQNLRAQWQVAMRRFMRDGKLRQLLDCEDLQRQIEALEAGK